MPDSYDKHIEAIAQHLRYPPMPEPRQTRPFVPLPLLQRVAAVMVLLLVAGFAIPDIRAAVFEVLQIGSATITLSGTTETGEPLRLADVSGDTTLRDASHLLQTNIYIPPDDLPDRVYLQDRDLLILLWVDGNTIERALYQVPYDVWGIYKILDNADITTVDDDWAVWGYQDHLVTLRNGETQFTHFVTDQVLIWTDGIVTFRLEGEMTMAEAVAFAESLVVYEGE